jgi:tRNA uridine 5-carbamoylmethylation protein Kti12
MAWVILAGADCVGKTTIAKFYERQGYKYIHLSAPDEKFFKDEDENAYFKYIKDMLENLIDSDVVFDRSWYDELVYADMYNREKALINEKHLEELHEVEEYADVRKIYLYDEDRDAHWERCKESNQPLSYNQFASSINIFEQITKEQEFEKYQMPQLKEMLKNEFKDYSDGTESKSHDKTRTAGESKKDRVVEQVSGGKNKPDKRRDREPENGPMQKLEYANSLKKVLSKKTIIGKTDNNFLEKIEKDIRKFLEDKLSSTLGEDVDSDFSAKEISTLKSLVKQLNNKTSKGK